MIKIFFVCTTLLFFLFFLPTQAQDSGREIYINAGLGLGVYNAGGVPLGASVEVGLIENISVGGFLDYARYSRKYMGNQWDYKFIYLGGRASYHLGILIQELGLAENKFDPYAGLSVGIKTATYKDNGVSNYQSPYSTGVFLGIHAGTRYYLYERFGVFGEIGYGVSALRLGLTLKLR